MAKKRRSKKQGRPSSSTPKPSPDDHDHKMPDISDDSHSQEPTAHNHPSPGEEQYEQGGAPSPLPEVSMRIDVDLEMPPQCGASSSADSPSSGLSTNGMLTDPSAVSLEVDSVSLFSPTHYPVVSPAFRTERPFDSQTLTSSRSLWAEDLDYRVENGRRYCANYYMPNDEEEQDRLRVIHQVYLSLFDLELTTVPLHNPKYILDIGTGTGEWAIGMGELYPECEVVGTDISAIQPAAVPHNVYFEIDDAELEWTRPADSIDLIHVRNLAGAFSDWNYIYEQCLHTLKPGGYIELLEFDDQKGFLNILSFFPPDSVAFTFARDLFEASVKSGRTRGIAHLDPKLLINIGFVDVTMTEHAIPLSPVEMSTGKLWLVACLCSLEALSMRLLTTYMAWDADRVRQTCDVLAQEIKDMALSNPKMNEVVVKVRVIVGRKPEQPGQWTAQTFHENGGMLPEETI